MPPFLPQAARIGPEAYEQPGRQPAHGSIVDRVPSGKSGDLYGRFAPNSLPDSSVSLFMNE